MTFTMDGHYANGRSALKISCSFEVIRKGIIGYQKELQLVPISCISKYIKSLLNDKQMKINQLEEIKEAMPATYELRKNHGTASFFDIILNNKENEPIGFLSVQYSNANSINFSTEEMNEVLKLKFFIEDKLEKMVKPE